MLTGNKKPFFPAWAILLLSLMVYGLPASADDVTPMELVKLTVDQVVADMNANQDVYAADQEKLRTMVLERVAPHFDFDRMMQLALGKYWPEATPDQRRRLSDEVLRLMVRTYATAMFQYRNYPLTVVDERMRNERSATVRLSTKTDTGTPVSVVLRMEKRQGPWRIMDVVIDGVSMVITYRGVFAEEIGNSSIDGLIESIRSENLAGVAP